jgi:large subunit ribosomal protein L25
MAEVLNVQVRTADGKRVARRLRREGAVPAILYGHGESNVPLSVKADQISAAVRHGSRVVELQGAANEKAFIRDLQWDVYGIDILHVDFTRVSEHERINVEVKVVLRGEAPGVKDAGVVEHLVHEVEIDCEALSIPEKLFLNINELKVGDSLPVSAIQLPAGVTLLSDPDQVAVQCVIPVEAEEGEAGEGAAEPEVIGRKAEEESDEE